MMSLRCISAVVVGMSRMQPEADRVPDGRASVVTASPFPTHPLQLEHPSAKPTSHPNEEFPASSPENAPGGERDCWLVTSPLAFENIGFTKGVVSNSDQGRPVEGAGSSSTTAAAATATTGQRDIPSLPEGARIRYLSCADCDCGPLGWHVEHKGSDLGRDVEEQIGRGTTAGGGGGGGGGGMVREFLIPVERCRYKVE